RLSICAPPPPRGRSANRTHPLSMAHRVLRARPKTARFGDHWLVKALDQRLLRYARAVRGFLVATIALGVLSALLIVAQAWLLADVVSGAFSDHRGLAQLHLPLAILLLVVLARATVAWAAELAASRSSARAKSQLRTSLLAAAR